MARLLAMAFSQLIDALHERLRTEGWDDVRRPYGFVLLAARNDAIAARTVAELLGVTKQATAKLLDAMERDGYIARDSSPQDARSKLVSLTARGRELLAAVETIYDDLEHEWADTLGPRRLEELRADLTAAVARDGGALPPVRPTW